LLRTRLRYSPEPPALLGILQIIGLASLPLIALRFAPLLLRLFPILVALTLACLFLVPTILGLIGALLGEAALRRREQEESCEARYEWREWPEAAPPAALPKRSATIHVDARRAHARAAECPYCGDSIEATPAACPTCETPHHEGCWSENGGCTIYACGSRPRSPARWEYPRPGR
jgi:hypothetical protein